MKKSILVLLLSIFFSYTAFAQSNFLLSPSRAPQTNPAATKAPLQKAAGDTLFYEDFSDSTLSNWTVEDKTLSNFNWIWSNSGPGGQYSASITGVNSVTENNGFLSLPSDFYNTPMPAGGPVQMDAWITSKAISITPSPAVEIRFQQYHRYCCNSFNELVLEVSKDSINWTIFDASGGRGPNTASPNPINYSIDLSSVLANEDTVYLRFRQTGASHYFWMIDDLMITEGYSNALELDSPLVDFFPDKNYLTHYTSMPTEMFCDPHLSAVVRNIGVNDQTGVALQTTLFNRPTGQINFQPVYTTTSAFQTIQAGASVSFVDSLQGAFPANDGEFFFEYELLSDSINQSVQLALDSSPIFNLLTSDTILARDFNQFNDNVGPSRFFGVLEDDGDAWAEAFELHSTSTVTALSVSVFIANDSSNIGVSLKPNLWRIQSDTLLTPAIASSPFSTIISAGMLGRWINLPIFPPVNLNPVYSYAAGIEQTAGAANGKYFLLGRDRIAELNSSILSHFVKMRQNGAPHRWVHPARFAGIRLNFISTAGGSSCNFITTDLQERSKERKTNSFSLQPNPASDRLRISFHDRDALKAEVRNKKGQIVYEEWIGGKTSLEMKLDHLSKGLYFVTVIHREGIQTQKLIVH